MMIVQHQIKAVREDVQITATALPPPFGAAALPRYSKTVFGSIPFLKTFPLIHILLVPPSCFHFRADPKITLQCVIHNDAIPRRIPMVI